MQARLSNSRIALPHSNLRVLLDIRTAQPIANFPAHLVAIRAESQFVYLYSAFLLSMLT